MIYPKLESGNNLSEVYQSSFFLPKYKILTISPFISTDFSGELEYGLISILSSEPYGTVSLAYTEKNVEQSFILPFANFKYSHKESAFNLTYQKRINQINLQIGGNFSDPIHLEAFQLDGQIIPSLNIGIQVEPSQYIMIEGGITNLFKESSNVVHDNSEQFFTAVSLMLLEDLAVKVSLHKFRKINNQFGQDSREERINANFLTRYYFSEKIYIGFNISSKPTVLSLGGGITDSFGSIMLFTGLKNKQNFFAFLSYTLFYNPDYKHTKGFIARYSNKINNKSSDDILININKANEKLLTILPGVGPKTAQKIMTHRKVNGFFYIKEDLMEVKGIGIKKFNKLKDYITVGEIDPKKRLSNIKRWTMKEFVELGFSPSLSLRLVLFIQNRIQFNKLDDLVKVKGFDQNKLRHLKEKLQQFGYDPK